MKADKASTTVTTSPCEQYFGHEDFAPRELPRCPVKGCTCRISQAPFRHRTDHFLPFCEEHGIRLHGTAGHNPTYVYYNGPRKEDSVRARRRNFRFEAPYVSQHVLNNPNKAETHRLGHELSEDALSWNVFVGLMRGGALSTAMNWLAGRSIQGEPELYMWGCRIDVEQGTHQPYRPLLAARHVIEPDISRFQTEPDVMLIVPNAFVMFLEAKFLSGNVLALPEPAHQREGEKPKSIRGLLDRYFAKNRFWRDGSKYICAEKIARKFHGQLFRNVVFAAGIAETFEADWQVVNLVRTVKSHRDLSERITKDVDSDDPTDEVRCYLTDEHKDRFTFRTWEGLYAAVVKNNPRLRDLAAYMEGKSAHFRPAFELDLPRAVGRPGLGVP